MPRDKPKHQQLPHCFRGITGKLKAENEMQSKPQNPPSKHHFVPEFLLGKWKNDEGDVYRYARNRVGQISGKWLAPGAIGYRHGLYATEGLQPEQKQQVEAEFMEPLDTAAHDAHQQLLAGKVNDLTDDQRCRWASLIMSLWFRTPGDIEGIRRTVDTLFDAQVSRAVLGLEVPADFPDAAKNQLVMDVMMRAIDDPERGTELINMRWSVIDIDPRRQFFISDAPLCHPTAFARLGAPQSYLTMPIAPTKLFVASASPTLGAELKALSQRELVQRQNRATVTQASHFVCATDRSADKFVRANFGIAEQIPLTANLPERYRALAAGAFGTK